MFRWIIANVIYPSEKITTFILLYKYIKYIALYTFLLWLLYLVLARQTIKDNGYPNCDEGWYDVQNQGVCNDFCRWVGNCGCRGSCSWWSCALAGSAKAYTKNGEYNAQETLEKKC